MKIAVFGTGMVGVTIANKLIASGHEVTMGSRAEANPKALAWAQGHAQRAHHGTYALAASDAELIFNCTNGAGSLEALTSASTQLEGKLVLDLSNPLDFAHGMPPSLFVSNTDSLGEQLQRALPKTRIIKTLNTITCELMVNPSRLGHTQHSVFLCGDDAQARSFVHETVLKDWFGWTHIIDLGDITGSRAMESYLPMWLRLWGALGTANFNISVTSA